MNPKRQNRCARSRRLASCAATILLVFWTAVVCLHAADPPTARLKTLTLDELMDVDVTSVTRSQTPVSEAAAAVDVLTGEEIRRSGATTLPEALRLAAGLFVARADGHTWAISTRGFAAPTSTKLLVLLDGRTVYSPLFAGVFWDVQDVPLADVERIEVIRGPGATLWGANAVNGVINVITKPASRTVGGRVEAGGGAPDQLFGTARYGDQLGALSYRTWAKYDALEANTTASGVSAHDALRRASAGGRADYVLAPGSDLSFIGSGYRGAAGLFDRPDITLYGWNVLGRWRRTLQRQGELQVQAYYDRTTRRVPVAVRGNARDMGPRRPVPVAPASAARAARRRRVSSHPRHDRRPRCRHGAVLGPLRPFRPVCPGRPARERVPPGRNGGGCTASVRHRRRAPRAERRYRRRGAADHPRAVESAPGRYGVGAVSRAVRTPSRLETNIRLESADGAASLVGNPEFMSESVVAYEAGYRVQATPTLFVDLAAYHNRYDRLRSTEPGTPLTLGNGFEGQTTGLETTFDYRPKTWMRWRASWTLFDKLLAARPGSGDPSAGRAEGNDPSQTFGLRAMFNLPKQVELDGYLRAIAALPNPAVPAYAELDLRAGWWLTPDWEVSIVGQNLLHGHHPEFGAPGPLRTE